MDEMRGAGEKQALRPFLRRIGGRSGAEFKNYLCLRGLALDGKIPALSFPRCWPSKIYKPGGLKRICRTWLLLRGRLPEGSGIRVGMLNQLRLEDVKLRLTRGNLPAKYKGENRWLLIARISCR
ncbi:MAG: hypothetical protein LBU32_24885 [Clostridiales bacterium]|nr:hypothetical protein [Clostridiales bacterium]